VLYKGGVEKSLMRKFLGSGDRHTVFKAELLMPLLVVELVKSLFGARILVEQMKTLVGFQTP